MDLTRDFVNKIEEMSAPHQIEHNGTLYTDKPMTALPCGPIATRALGTETLSSIVDYIKFGTDRDATPVGRHVIHVEGPSEVGLYKEMDEDKQRDHLLTAMTDPNGFPFGRFMDVENFIINLQSCFVQDENTAKLLNFVATVRQDTGVEQQDDGITQRVTARSGVSLARSVNAPNPVTLRPFRTFSEVEQPASPFVFRVHSDDSGVSMGLFEADGSAWKHQAIINIRDYLKKALDGEDVIILA